MYVADELASTPRIAVAVPTVPHSSVLACMTTSWACQVSATVAPMSGPSATFGPAPTPLSSCHCCCPGSSARDCSRSCTMRRTASSEPSRCPPATPVCPTGVAGCGNRDTLPCAPHGNISQWSCPQRLQFAKGGPFRSKVYPLLLVITVWSPTCDILAWTCGWFRVPVSAACGQFLAQCPIWPHTKHCPPPPPPPGSP